jgi:hypothetical protein
MRVHAFLALFVLAPLSDALAQAPPLEPGQRVRVTAPDLGVNRQSAVLETLRGDMLVVVEDSTIRIPVASVTRIDVHRGRHGHPWRGAGIGFLAGAATGAVAGAILCQDGCIEWDTGAVVALGAAVFSASGAVVGGVVGAFIKTDKWEEVPLDRLHLSFVPEWDGRLTLGLSVSF